MNYQIHGSNGGVGYGGEIPSSAQQYQGQMPAPPPPDTTIRGALAEQEQRLSMLFNAIDAAHGRFASVLAPEQPTPSNGAATGQQIPDSVLGRIREHNRAIDIATARLIAACDRCQL